MTKYTIHYECGNTETGKTIEEAAAIAQIGADEIQWAIEEDGQCTVEDAPGGEMIIVEDVEDDDFPM